MTTKFIKNSYKVNLDGQLQEVSYEKACEVRGVKALTRPRRHYVSQADRPKVFRGHDRTHEVGGILENLAAANAIHGYVTLWRKINHLTT